MYSKSITTPMLCGFILYCALAVPRVLVHADPMGERLRKAPATPEQQFVKKIYLRYLKSRESSSAADDLRNALMAETHWETRLNIKVDLPKMKATFKRYGVLLLRPLQHEKLIIGCGNAVR